MAGVKTEPYCLIPAVRRTPPARGHEFEEPDRDSSQARLAGMGARRYCWRRVWFTLLHGSAEQLAIDHVADP